VAPGLSPEAARNNKPPTATLPCPELEYHVLFFVHLILLPEAREYAASLIDRLLFGRLLDLQLKMQNLMGHQLSKTFWVTAIGMWMPRPYSRFFSLASCVTAPISRCKNTALVRDILPLDLPTLLSLLYNDALL
jgi:hypothetical protein